ncbi:MAG: hypothetical protein R3F60_02660 [bacterium]
MSRARAAIAARTTVEELMSAALTAFGKTAGADSATFDDFFDAASFCRPLCEELGGEVGSDAWYSWQHGEWAILGDLGLLLQRRHAALAALSERVGELVVGAVDTGFEYAHFAVYDDGEMRRRLTLEDEALELEGLPVAAERGRHLEDFSEEEAERLWTSYGLPTFEYDPEEGRFRCQQVSGA